MSEVDAVEVEQWTPQRRRRSDVQVRLVTGEVIAIEVQQQQLTDEAWRGRHRDYAEAGIADVWLWHPGPGAPGVVYEEDQPGWVLDLDAQQVVGLSAPDDDGSSMLVTAQLNECALTPTGLALPDHLLKVAAESEQHDSISTATAEQTDDGPSGDHQLLFSDGGGEMRSVRRGQLMLFPGGRRPPSLVFTLVSEPGEEHLIYRPDALSPYANPSSSPRFLCRTCGLVLSSLTDHP